MLNGFGRKESTPASIARNPASPLQLAEEQIMGSRRLFTGMSDASLIPARVAPQVGLSRVAGLRWGCLEAALDCMHGYAYTSSAWFSGIRRRLRPT